MGSVLNQSKPPQQKFNWMDYTTEIHTLTALEAGKPKISVPARSVSSEDPLPGWQTPHCHLEEKGEQAPSVFTKALIPAWELHRYDLTWTELFTKDPISKYYHVAV